MSGRSLCWCCLFFTWISLSPGIRLYPCGGDGYRDVEENTNITFYCDQYTGNVPWQYLPPGSNNRATIASCNDTACAPSPYWTVTYISAGNSSLTTTYTSRSSYSGSGYKCGDQKCRLHVIVSAEVSQPTTNITRQDSGYTLSVSADVTQVYSSRGQYSCIGQLGSSSQTTQPDLTPPASDVSNKANRTGKCDVTMPLPVTSGTYPCSVTVTPGNTQRSCGNITITRPPPPTISCPSDLIPENTPFACTCNTSNIGQPGGRLRWYTGTGSNVNTEVIRGNYDINTLAMTRTVTRGDNNVRKFRCVNNWMVNVPAQSDYTARVAWGPDTVSIQGNRAFYTDTTRSQIMTLTCQASGVNPSPSLTYSWDKLCDEKQQSMCTFKAGPGDDNTVIRCTVTNVNNNNRQQHKTVTLDIKYPPSSAPQISGYSGGVLYEGDHLNLTCTVTGGDPMVTSVTLTCPGRHIQGPTIGQSSTLEIYSLNASDHNLTCVCRGQWTRQDYYTLRDSRTLTVYFPVKSVHLTVNSQTLLEAREGQSADVTFQCTAGFARPSPNLVLSDDQGREVARLTGGNADVTGQQSVLTHTLRRVRCENSAVYTCTAENGVGKPIQSTATLRVLCDMRVLRDSFSSRQDGTPVVEAGREPGELHFQVLTTDTPHTVSFLYLGPDSAGAGYSPTAGLLSATCTQTSVAYKSRCVIRASNVTQDWIGYYNVTIATGTQSISFTFRLQMKESSDSRCPICSCGIGGQWFEGFGAGVGVGLAILVVADVVILLCVWRRQWKLPCAAERPSNKSVDNDTPAHVESSLETEMSACATSGTGPYEELKHSDIGLRSEYSDISGSSPHSPETDGGYEIPLQRRVPAAAATGR